MIRLTEEIAQCYMVQCRNSKDFECPYSEDYPAEFRKGICKHEDKDICQWQREQAKEIIKKVWEWGNETCPHSQVKDRKPHRRQCSVCWRELEQEIK